MTCVVISQPMYFPWAGFYEQMRLADVFVWLDDAQFSKGSFTNRVQVLVPGKTVWMTVPLAGKTRTKIKDLNAQGEAWPSSHRALLEQSLRDRQYAETALSLFDRSLGHDKLVDVLIASCQEIAPALGAEPMRYERSSKLDIDGRGSKRVLDIVRHFGANRYVTGHGAANYLDYNAFELAGAGVEFMDYSVRPWPQTDGEFTPYVTALDLVAARGHHAPEHLSSRTMHWSEFNERKGESVL